MTKLKTENLTKRFGNLVAVDDVSLSVEEGELVGLIGPNGAGKTTLFNLMTGYYKPTEGTVTYEGEDITGAAPFEISRRGLVRTFQVPKPLAQLTVEENVIVGALSVTENRTEARELARDTLDRVNYPGEYDAVAANLNVAKLKRLELAKAVATQPNLLMLDEVVAGLNREERQGMMRAIETLNDQGMTILMVEHIMDVVMNLAERVLVLNEGALIASGTPSEIQSNDEVIRVYLGTE